MARKPTESRRLPLVLTPIQRQVLRLRLEGALSFSEIARRLGRQKSTVYQNYLYAIEKAKRIKAVQMGEVTSP